jgi:hypothetical protein
MRIVIANQGEARRLSDPPRAGASDARRELEDGEEPSQGIEVLGVHGVLLGGVPECVVKVNLQVVELRVNITESPG